VEGTGNVTIEANLIQGNLTGAGSGAGIRAFAVNANDVRLSPIDDASWNRLNIINNIIVNNVAGVAGGGISLQDVLRARIVNNTISNNDSTATGILAFQAGAANSTPQPAGVVSAPHSAALQALIQRSNEPTFSNPVLLNNIVWHNRSFYNNASLNGGAGGLAPDPAGPYWDLGVINAVGVPPEFNPEETLLSVLNSHGATYGGSGNFATTTPGFVLDYINTLQTATVTDEGGNNINVTFTPLNPAAGNYHITAGSPAVNQGRNAGAPATDFDYQPRSNVDIGADEVSSAAPVPPPGTGTGTVQAYFSTSGNTTVPGVAGPYSNADIYVWLSDGSYARVFTAGATGVPNGANVDAFVYNGPTDAYLSFSNSFNWPGIGAVGSADIVHWNGTAWSMYFQGSDVGLTTNAENVDAFALLTDGSLLVSTSGSPTVTGLTGLTSQDLLRCAGTFGATTSCTWSLYFDGSDVALTTGSENVDFARVTPGAILLSTTGSFSAASGASSLTGTGSQVFACSGPVTGTNTACTGLSNVLTLPAGLPQTDAINLP